MSNYELKIDQIVQKIRENNYHSVLIQFPEGMLDKPLNRVKEILLKEKIKVYVAGDPSYGICDLAVVLAKKLKCELLVHFGHSEFGFQSHVSSVSSEPVDVILVPAYYTPPKELDYTHLISEIKKKNWKTVGLASTIQHVKSLDKLEELLKLNDFRIIRRNSGQVLGCNINSLKQESMECDGFISIHAGFFHTHGILLNLNKPLIQFDPYSERITCYEEIDHNKAVQQRFTVLTNAKKAVKWGILGSSKFGQFNPKMISKIQSTLAERNIDDLTVVAENINPQILANFSYIDAWVVTACPRIAIDDKIRYNKPVITFREFLYLFEQLNWNDLVERGFF
ncbi:MAG: diphthamide biosynthesis enzyme Dph2 [Candidatus Hodarchaeales archaeon]|jgi:2-(3-amino-3-carboxypropyl)histidine synthase